MTKELMKAPGTLSVWESNMKELRTLQPKLAGLLDDYVAEHGHEFRHFENKTPAGRWIDGLAARPFFEPSEEPKFEWSRKKRDKDKPVFFLYGVGTPPYLFKAIRQLPDLALSFIVLEPNIELLAYTLHLTHVYFALPKGCRLTFLTKDGRKYETDEEREASTKRNADLRDEAMRGALTFIGVYSAVLALVSGHPGETEIFRQEFSDLSESARNWITVTLALMGNSAEDTLIAVRQMALLSPWIAYGKNIDVLAERFKDYPVISVAAGPSLDRNFLQLREVQDRCVIIAADAVLEKLLDNGIKPHIVTCLERVIQTYTLFFSKVVDKYKEECRDILLVSQSLVVPWIVGRWPGPLCIVGKGEAPLDNWLVGGILGGSRIASGTSVAHVNFSLANLLGAENVAAIGQDLAYAESGESHAGNIGASWNMRTRQGDVITIPGSVTETVQTNSVWLSFLSVLERIIAGYRYKAWDCTEGGARIAGTEVAPLADFISEHVVDLEPMPKRPSDIVRDAPGKTDREKICRDVVASIENQYKQFEFLDSHLKNVEELVEKAVAPGLEPNRRIFYAAAAGRGFDDIHARSDVFDFIGQSYTRLASIELSLTRALDTAENVARWRRMHEEIIRSHRAVLDFIRKWLSYAAAACRELATAGDAFRPLEPEEARAMAEELLPRLASIEDEEREEIISLRIAIDDMMARCDPVMLKWPGRMLWNMAMILMLEGRAALATYFMEAAERDFDGKEMPVEETIAFLKDYARVLIGHDLVHTPQPYRAEVMLANAIEAGGIDEEIKEIASEIVEAEIALRSMSDELHGIRTLDWHRARAEAQKALYEGKLDEAILLVWRAIQKNWHDVPGWAASHLDWLAATLERCREAESLTLVAIVEQIIDEMASATELLSNVRITFTKNFAEELAKRGLALPLPTKPSQGTKCGETIEPPLPPASL